ncbi:GNAT family N-acetyltransferase [Streptomyces albogriseolus]|uniref:GNAT family N-acetyltransferase n=1 Tax=Streptomyces albogriseolus TaxID=1887 RepID=UPI00345FF197
MPIPAPLTTAPRQPVLPHTGTRTITRPATLDDFDAVNALHDRCSLATRFARYQAARRSLRVAEFHHLTRPDRSLTWVTHPEDDPQQVIATTSLVRTTEPDTAELGIMIEDPWQNRGLGTTLAQYARAQARTLGCSLMTVMTGSDNVRMLKIMKTLGAARPAIHSSTVDLTVPVE